MSLSYGAGRVGLVASATLQIMACAVASHPSPPVAAASIQSAPWGNVATGAAADLFVLRNAHGVEVQLTNYGGIITSIKTADRAGRFADIVLGYDSLAGYLRDSPYFGAIVGRYANRIARGRFTLDGTTYTLAVNNGPNSLHGGRRGSTFQSILPIFARRHVGAINWGFVSGKTQTIYPWDSWNNEYTAEPKVWFHDIFRAEGTPYDSAEVRLIRSLTMKRHAS
jgi:hypothetical protein